MDLYGRFLEPRSLRVQKRDHATHELGLFSSKTAKLREIKKRLDLLCGQASQDEERTTTQVVYCFLGALVSIDDPVAELLNIAPRLRMVDGVVEAPLGAHFTECPPDYGRDEAFQREYASTARSPEAWEDFRKTYLELGSESEYREAIRTR